MKHRFVLTLALFAALSARAVDVSTYAGTISWTDAGTSMTEVALTRSGTYHGDGFDTALSYSVNNGALTVSSSFHYMTTYGVCVQQVVVANNWTGIAQTYDITASGNLGSDGGTTWHYASASSPYYYTVSSDNPYASNNGSDPVISLLFGDARAAAAGTARTLVYGAAAGATDNYLFTLSGVTVPNGQTHRYLFLCGVGDIADAAYNRPDVAIGAVSTLLNTYNWPAEFTSFLSDSQKAEVVNWGVKAITAVTPARGSAAGGETVTITGADLCNGTLADVTGVSLCGVSVASITGVSGPGTITVVTAPGTPGTAGNVVVTSASRGTTVGTGLFTYANIFNTAAGLADWINVTAASIEDVYLTQNGISHTDGYDGAFTATVSGAELARTEEFRFSRTYGAVVKHVTLVNNLPYAQTYTLTVTGNLGSDGSTTWHYVGNGPAYYSVSSDSSSAAGDASDPVISFLYGDSQLHALGTARAVSYSGGSDSQSFSVSGVTIPASGTHRYLFISGVGDIDDAGYNRADQAYAAVQNLLAPATWPADFTSFLSAAQLAQVVNWKFPQIPTVTAWPTASPIRKGQALSASALSGGSASVSGTFAFTAPATLPPEGAYPASVTFTPADGASYLPVTGTVTVNVIKHRGTFISVSGY